MLAWKTSLLRQATVASVITFFCVQVAPVAAQDATLAVAPAGLNQRVEVEDVHLRLSSQVMIYRDEWGTPHVHGATDEAAIFGMGYVQSEDYFWQVEDNCIRALGRYSELAGEKLLRADTLNRLFEVPRRSKEDYERLSDKQQKLLAAFTHGINYFLATHPDVKPRLIHRFEPHYVLAMDRYLLLDFVYGKAHAGRPNPRSFEAAVQEATGSNQWAVGPSRTKAGSTMLLINPHQPWYGSGQFYEAHLISDEGTNFSGGCFYGNPIPTLGFNKYLGWAYTVNEPDVADVFRVKFSGKPKDGALEYKFGDETRSAETWDDVILVKKGKSLVEKKFTFYKTHHGPIVRFENDTTGLAVRIAALFDLGRVDQAHEMIHATNFEQWYDAMRHCGIPMFNVAYADRDGNIFYAYNGAIPVRDSRFDWREPVNGNDPATEWKGIYAFDDLPQVLNPPSGYVQNCNTSPFLTTDEGNPNRGDFPAYMFEDRDEDKRRAKMSRRLLRSAMGLTFDDFRRLSLDTTLYWPLQELPRFRRDFESLKKENPPLAEKVRPFLEHLLDWDCKVIESSTQATLCEAWYIELYGEGYPAETIRGQYESSRMSRL
ncbi:MAG: penicillin acylase family protein, partial [Planctomycetota bacterium]